MKLFVYLLLFLCLNTQAFSEIKTKTLSLNEAILLAVRQNPNVQSSRLEYVNQKFALWVEQWEFLPQYTFTAEASTGRVVTPGQSWRGSHGFNASPGVSLLTPIGTNISLTSSFNKSHHFNPQLALDFTQPLLRGFGNAIVETALHNAEDSLVVSRLGIEGLLRTTVTAVITAYLDVVSAEKRIQIDEEALKRAEKSVNDTQLFIKAGKKAGNDLVTVKANVASAKSNLENDKNALLQARYALLTAIGLNPNAEVRFANLDLDHIISKYHVPPLALTKQLTLENDINYQTAEIMLHGQKCRSLLAAEDNARWKLDAHAHLATGGGSGGGQAAGFNSLWNFYNQNQSVDLKLEIPIDNQRLKQSILNAKIGLQQAEIAQRQKKWSIETSAINGWNSVTAAERSLAYAEDAEKLQQRSYHLSYEKYLHGLIDSLELQSAQFALIQEQQNLLRNRVEYLKALVNLDQAIGHTLKTWDIQVRL